MNFLKLSLLHIFQEEKYQETLLDGLVAYWKMDESSGNAFDSTGRGNTLVNTGTLVFGPGKINNGATPDGGARKLSIINNADNTMGGESFTISSWVSLAAKPAALQYIWSKGGSYSLYWDNASDRFVILSKHGGANKFLSASSFGSPSLNTLYHILWGWDSSAGYTWIRINMGVVDYYPPVLAPLDDAAITLYLCANNNSNPMNGILDEVGLWKRKLTESEQIKLYNGGEGLGFPFPFRENWYLAFEGDSQTVRGNPTTDYPGRTSEQIGTTNIHVYAKSGSRMNVEVFSRASEVMSDAQLNSGFKNRVLFVWAGLNDMYTNNVVSPSSVMQFLQNYCVSQRSSGVWSAIVVMTLTPSTVAGTDPSYESRRLEFNSSLRNSYSSWADYLLDIGGDSIYGDISNCGNTLYFDDQIHLSSSGRKKVSDMAVEILRFI